MRLASKQGSSWRWHARANYLSTSPGVRRTYIHPIMATDGKSKTALLEDPRSLEQGDEVDIPATDLPPHQSQMQEYSLTPGSFWSLVVNVGSAVGLVGAPSLPELRMLTGNRSS